jgi:hypothetical protein
MMEGLALSGQEAAHGGVGAHGLQELHGAHEGDPDTLVRELFDGGPVFSGEELKQGLRLLDGGHGHGDVVQGR